MKRGILHRCLFCVRLLFAGALRQLCRPDQNRYRLNCLMVRPVSRLHLRRSCICCKTSAGQHYRRQGNSKTLCSAFHRKFPPYLSLRESRRRQSACPCSKAFGLLKVYFDNFPDKLSASGEVHDGVIGKPSCKKTFPHDHPVPPPVPPVRCRLPCRKPGQRSPALL